MLTTAGAERSTAETTAVRRTVDAYSASTWAFQPKPRRGEADPREDDGAERGAQVHGHSGAVRAGLGRFVPVDRSADGSVYTRGTRAAESPWAEVGRIRAS